MIIGTAGHIDHGKSALVTALTGRRMDRLVEEQRRGITIDLNFAPLGFPGLPPAGIVDVPGHEDFVRTMVAGASGIDLVLLVVDAAQGPQPQTWEHLAIVEQLGVRRGIPVITKADLAEPEWIELVREELGDRLAGSTVAFEPAAVVSALTRQGIPELADRLRVMIETAAAPPAELVQDAFRMPVDRAFSVAGVGTVVTGTPWSGSLRVGDAVTLLPAGRSGRVRSIEAYGAPVEQARPGQRTAVGIAGLERSAIRRGETLVQSGANGKLAWQPTTALDGELRLLPAVTAVRRQARVRVHLGTAEVLARVYPRGEARSGTLLARLALESPLVARGGDRFVLRSYSPVTTIGGGCVLDPLPPRRAIWPAGLAAEPIARLEALVVRRAAGAAIDELPLLLGLSPAKCREVVKGSATVATIGTRVVSSAAAGDLRAQALVLVKEYHTRHPDLPGLSLETLRRSLRGPAPLIDDVIDGLVQSGEATLRDGVVSLPGFRSQLTQDSDLIAQVLARVEAGGLAPPSVEELEQGLGRPNLVPVLRHLASEGRIKAVDDGRYFSTKALDEFVEAIRQVAQKEPVTPARLRDYLGVSRKYLIPLLEWADRSGVTRRVGDSRVVI
ncbi:MAG: selenocysteine-specific translation elongation factor [Gemmatimonadales bacterium]